MAGKGINKVILIGNLGADPEVRYMPNGGAVTNIRLATTESWRDKQTGEQQERTEWHRIVFFNRLAEITGEYLKTGSKIFVEGSLRTRKWQDKNNIERYTTEIVANVMQMLSARNPSYEKTPPSSQQPQVAAQHAQQQATTPPAETVAAATQQGAGSPSDDDDIPF